MTDRENCLERSVTYSSQEEGTIRHASLHGKIPELVKRKERGKVWAEAFYYGFQEWQGKTR